MQHRVYLLDVIITQAKKKFTHSVKMFPIKNGISEDNDPHIWPSTPTHREILSALSKYTIGSRSRACLTHKSRKISDYIVYSSRPTHSLKLKITANCLEFTEHGKWRKKGNREIF